MRENPAAQPIKPDERAEPSAAAGDEPQADDSEHEIKPAISGWVREHEHRAAEFARAFKDLLAEEGFLSSQTTDFQSISPKRKM